MKKRGSMTIWSLRQAIERHGLFEKGDHVLLCASGGADSMALLLGLSELAPKLGIRLTVCHLNHRLRGEDAEEDELFVSSAAARLGLKCVIGRRDVKRLARARGESIEMAGRIARYDFFARAARTNGCSCVATAHTAEDQAETILLRIARGVGGRGLRGIPRAAFWKGVRIVRPLRDFSREAIVGFLSSRGIGWREDASNRDPIFQRNLVRHQIIPFLEAKLNPNLREALLRLGDISEEENEWLESLAGHVLNECRASGGEIACDKLSLHPAAARRRCLRSWLVEAGLPPDMLSFQTTEQLDLLAVSSRGSRAAQLGDGWIARREYNLLKIERELPERSDYSVKLPVPGRVALAGTDLEILASLGVGFEKRKPVGIGCYPQSASISAGKWRRRQITVRSWMPGDKMCPFGMNGSKKIQDIFSDLKIPKELRCGVPLFVCGGEIIWLPGYRIARGWEVPSQSAGALQLSVRTVKRRKAASRSGSRRFSE